MYLMTARMSDRAVRRSPLPLTARDVEDLAKLRGERPAWKALWRLVRTDTPDDDVSEAALLHAVFVVGLRAVQEAAEEASYAADAATYEAEDTERRARARRRTPGWAGER